MIAGTSEAFPRRGGNNGSFPFGGGEGPKGEWAVVYAEHAPAAFSFARSWLCNTALAEEVVQDVFVSLWTQSDDFDPSRGSFRSYLLTRTRWRCVDVIRAEESRRSRERRSASGCELYSVPEHEEHQEEADGRDALEWLRHSLVRLPLKERLPIDLAYFGELTYKEVAEVLEWPEGTVKSRIRRGLHRLRAHADVPQGEAFLEAQ